MTQLDMEVYPDDRGNDETSEIKVRRTEGSHMSGGGLPQTASRSP